MINNNLLEELIHAPLILLTIKDKEIINQVNNLISYSTGFEIECDQNKNIYKVENFTSIPDIMDVDNSTCEQRYRIPNGIKGMLCLYNICYQLKINSLLNSGSGIHYHIDCRDAPILYKDNKILDENSDWILPILDTWDFRGSQSRGIGSSGIWIRISYHKTLEFRIGNMSFDYKVLLKNIISANNIVRRLKDELNIEPPTFEQPDVKKLLEYAKTNNYQVSNIWQSKMQSINSQLEKIKEKEIKPTELTEDVKTIVSSRSHRIVKPSK